MRPAALPRQPLPDPARQGDAVDRADRQARHPCLLLNECRRYGSDRAGDSPRRNGNMQLSDINLIDRDRYVPSLPLEMFDTLRREAPVSWHEEGDPGGRRFWAVTDYHGVVEANREIERFSSARGSALITETAEEKLAHERVKMLNIGPP